MPGTMRDSVRGDLKEGLKDGLPIGLGYLSVSFAYGMMTVMSGLQ